MVAQALLDAERHVAEHLTRGLDAGQRQLLDALLLPHAGTNLSVLAWVRQPPGKPGRKTFAAIIERLTLLRAIGIDPDIAAGVHPERLRRLCQEGARLTAQHVRTLQATRRRATLVATILEIIVTLTDDAVLMLTACLANRNIIYEGTLSNTFYARQNSEYLRASSYRVEIDGMAVDPDLSHPRTYNRRAAQIAASPTGFGRGVGDKFHDDAVAGLVSTIKALQDEGKGPDIAGR